MIRNCFLCKSPVKLIFSTPWALPGLKTTDIGFSICQSCGSVCQSPTVSFEKMMEFYQSVAVYTNPGREEKPSEAKIRDLDEQIQFIKRGIGSLPNSALQIGSSDGYTLSRFKNAGVSKVLGVEPGKASVEVAKRLYNIDCINDTAESFSTDGSFDLILLTHVLEHLYDPQTILAKCRGIQDRCEEGYIYVEVPLLSPVDSLCPGFFSFEHINYYSRDNLIKSLTLAGYSPVSLVEHYNSNLSPAIGILASTRKQNHIVEPTNEYSRNKAILSKYRNKEVSYWQSCLDNISNLLVTPGRTFLWGAGIHTSQLVANTNLLEKYSIKGLVDTSSLKWGVRQGDWLCCDPKSVDWQAGDKVIISSYASEKEIYDALSWLRDKNVSTLRLHNIDDSKAH
jgi:hypothetical protein